MDSIEKDFIEVYKNMTISQGLDRQYADIMGLVMLSPGELSLDDIARKTKYSLASVSSKLSMLEQLGIVTKIRKPKSRKVYVDTESDLFKMHANVVKGKLEGIKSVLSEMPVLIEKHKSKKLSESQRTKLKRIQKFYRFIELSEKLLSDVLVKINKLRKEL